MDLTQEEFLHLIGLKKEFREKDQISLGSAWSRDIISIGSQETFLLDFRRGYVSLKKFSYNKRFKKSIVLLRYCSDGRHTNPDGTRFDGPHFHIHKEGFDTKIAVPVQEIGVLPTATMPEVLEKILDYCNIQNIPTIQESFF